MLLLALAMWKSQCPSYIPASPLSDSLTPAGTLDDPTCASVWESRIPLETSPRLWTLSFFVIYLVLIFLFTVRVHSAENHSSALAHVRIAPHCVCRRLNQTWAETLHSKSTTEREFLTGIALT